MNLNFEVRNLSGDEKSLYSRILKRTRPHHNINKNDIGINYRISKKITRCLISDGSWNISIGYAKRNKSDKFNIEVGKRLSFTRAVENMIKPEVRDVDEIKCNKTRT